MIQHIWQCLTQHIWLPPYKMVWGIRFCINRTLQNLKIGSHSVSAMVTRNAKAMVYTRTIPTKTCHKNKRSTIISNPTRSLFFTFVSFIIPQPIIALFSNSVTHSQKASKITMKRFTCTGSWFYNPTVTKQQKLPCSIQEVLLPRRICDVCLYQGVNVDTQEITQAGITQIPEPSVILWWSLGQYIPTYSDLIFLSSNKNIGYMIVCFELAVKRERARNLQECPFENLYLLISGLESK